jgi:type I site-specific restriction endonuclease
MAKEIASRKKKMPGRGGVIAKAETRARSKALRKKAAKPVSQKRRKTVKNGSDKGVKPRPAYAADYGLMTAFHHMQRASVVMSLMEEGTGEDLRDLLKRGIKLYRKAVEDDAGSKIVLQAIGILRAVEHLSMAGLYAARVEHKQKVTSPTPEWLAKVTAESDRRLEQIEHLERGRGTDLFPVTVELVRRAEGSDHDAHLAFELAMAADALCFALENGL